MWPMTRRLGAPVLGDFLAELIQFRHRLVRVVQQPLFLLPFPPSLLSILPVLTSLPRVQVCNLPVVEVNHYIMPPDSGFDGLDELVKPFDTKKDDVARRRAGVFAGVVGVKPSFGEKRT
jgi:hypothetical protein